MTFLLGVSESATGSLSEPSLCVTPESQTRADKSAHNKIASRLRALRSAYKEDETRPVATALLKFLKTKEGCYGFRFLSDSEQVCLLSLDVAICLDAGVLGWLRHGKVGQLKEASSALTRIGAPWAANALSCVLDALPDDVQRAVIHGDTEVWFEFEPSEDLEDVIDGINQVYGRNETALAPGRSIKQLIIDYARNHGIE